MSSFGFDVSNTKPQAAFDPLPPGWYAMRITKSEMVAGRTEEIGRMAKLEFEVIDERVVEFAGRRVFSTLCVSHQNKQTRDIARSQVAAIAIAIGNPKAQNADDLLGGELMVKLTVKPARKGDDGTDYDAKNEVKGFKALGTADPTPAGSAPAAAAAAGGKPAASTTPTPAAQPWKR